jgi:hypothetical protein
MVAAASVPDIRGRTLDEEVALRRERRDPQKTVVQRRTFTDGGRPASP